MIADDDTQVDDTQVDDTQVDDTQVDDTQVDDTQVIELANRAALVEQVVQAQRQLMTAIHATMDDSWLQLELTMAQLKGLMALADTSMTIGQIAEALGIGKPAASILVERLVQPGLAERAEDPQDRRRSIAQLTAQGAELVARLRQEGGHARFQSWIGQLADDDLAALVRGMTALAMVATREREQVTAERTAARKSDLALAE